ncbi:ATP-grasp fold amidoligase family protein [Peribacillus deserti]|uniref:Glycosyl transferase n=1 Tax=Peribacillus deserti TaxID=673318 RepID=A0A2N5MBR2_9BACI|nr:ATP-grasp fold amidoligase family protein [Peribacillus deserti]PLT31794.1 glycosyl transferase [Peribacillus deserti]
MYNKLKSLIRKYRISTHVIAVYQLVKSHILFLIVRDEKTVKFQYRKMMGRELDLKNPITFNEKIQWLKLNDRNPDYSNLVDKLEVRSYVKNKIGEQYLNKLYRVFNNVDEISIDKLPGKFVLKTTHDSGGIIVCKNKNEVNWATELLKFRLRLKQNYYFLSREYHYKNVKPKVICEELLEDNKYGDLLDFKIFCFNGKPSYIQVDIDRFTNHKRNFYDINWNLMEFKMVYENSNKVIEKPENLVEMLSCAEKLSENIIFCRVDFFEVNQKIIFGEITFFPEAGYGKITPEEYEINLGELIKLK